VTREDVIEVYDVATGAVLRRGTEILLVRLADGRSLRLAAGRKPVLADLEPTGLYYSYATAGGGGRLVLVPRAEVVQRLEAGAP
jgi:hypothetical protein